MAPEFPVTVTFQEDGDQWVFDTLEELECSLEWFDSEDPAENATTVDAKCRAVRVKVIKLEALVLDLRQD